MVEKNQIIRVAWICSFSNEQIRSHIKTKEDWLGVILGKNIKKFKRESADTAIWNTNAIKEFEKIDDVEVHVICPVRKLSTKRVDYEEKGIHYHFFREQNSSTIKFIFHYLFTRYTSQYKKNRKHIKNIIKEIAPELVHVMGAENPFYSLSILDIPENIPTILQLQALLCRLIEVTSVPEEKKSFYNKGVIEQKLIKRADYIGTAVNDFRNFIVNKIKPEAVFLDTTLHMSQEINLDDTPKKHDFVYFALDISKAGEDALEAFILAHKKRPGITLDFVGGYSPEFRNMLDKKIQMHNLESSVIFEGRLPTHEDVVRKIRESRFALLPLKMDIVPNTIHEALGNGLPVITTETEGTPKLNRNRQTILISKQGDYHAMSENMVRLIDDSSFAQSLIYNGFTYENERGTNRDVALGWVNAYKHIIFKNK